MRINLRLRRCRFYVIFEVVGDFFSHSVAIFFCGLSNNNYPAFEKLMTV